MARVNIKTSLKVVPSTVFLWENECIKSYWNKWENISCKAEEITLDKVALTMRKVIIITIMIIMMTYKS